MHNLYAYFVRIVGVCKRFSNDLVNDKGNIPRFGVVPRFSDLELIALSLTEETKGYDSEYYLFGQLNDYRDQMPNLISRHQYNHHRKYTAALSEKIRKRIADNLDGGEEIFIVDSKPVKVFQPARGNRKTMGKTCPEKAPDFGYCATQALYYFGYKLHAVCGISGVIHSCDLTKASFHDIKYLNDEGQDYFRCTIIGGKAYLSADIRYNLFDSVNIQLEVPYLYNQKDWKPFHKPFDKARKRLETNFSQFNDQFNIMRNYAKDCRRFFTRIISKVSAFTVSEYINKMNDKPIGRIKFALA